MTKTFRNVTCLGVILEMSLQKYKMALIKVVNKECYRQLIKINVINDVRIKIDFK